MTYDTCQKIVLGKYWEKISKLNRKNKRNKSQKLIQKQKIKELRYKRNTWSFGSNTSHEHTKSQKIKKFITSFALSPNSSFKS